jgi:NADPH:quinone reductase-like Zn-dependent oxidoreductase
MDGAPVADMVGFFRTKSVSTGETPMSKVVRIHQPGGPECMVLEEIPDETPGPGEALIEMKAIGLNRAEAMFRQGRYIQPPGLPTRIGYEGSGVVAAVGGGVEGVKVGDKVSIVPSFQQGKYGVYAEKALVPGASLLPMPEGLSFEQAASIWMQYFTAWGIAEVGKVGMGDYVLIPAASSSVGLAAIQICNWAGAAPVALTRRSAKAAALKAQGAAHVVATEEQNLVDEVMKITSGKGARIVFDPVGGPYVETLAQAMATNGILFQYGGLSGEQTPYPHWNAAFKGLSVRGWVASEIWGRPEAYARVRALILRGLQEGRLKPVIAKTFPLAEIVDAHRYLESNQQVGKVVVTV